MTQRSTLGHNPCFCRTALHDITKAAFEEAASWSKKLCPPRVYYSSPRDCLKFNTAAANYLLTSQIRRWSPAAVAS